MNDSSTSGSILMSLSPDSALSGSNTLGNPELQLLRSKNIRGLYKKNKKLLNEIIQSNNLVIGISTTEWETRFRPLKYAEVCEIWKKLVSRNKVTKENAGMLDDNLLHLGDRAWLTIGTIENSHPQDIYPYSLFHCFKEQIKSDAVPT
jgi:hypothetical protein